MPAAFVAFDVVVDDGTDRQLFRLAEPGKGLFIPAGLWRELFNFSEGSICLVLASRMYQEEDYIRDFEEFISYKNSV